MLSALILTQRSSSKVRQTLPFSFQYHFQKVDTYAHGHVSEGIVDRRLNWLMKGPDADFGLKNMSMLSRSMMIPYSSLRVSLRRERDNTVNHLN